MMTDEKLRKFLGPVQRIGSYHSELTDGGIYTSAEQLAQLTADATKYSVNLANSTIKTIGRADLSVISLDIATRQSDELWRKLEGQDTLLLGMCSARTTEFFFACGLMWGAHLARTEKR